MFDPPRLLSIVTSRCVMMCLALVSLWGCSAAGPGSPSDLADAGSSNAALDAARSATSTDGPPDVMGAPADASFREAMTVGADATGIFDAASDRGAIDGAASPAGVVVGAGAAAQCVPLCRTVTTPSSPSAPDWSYENNASCVLPNSLTGKSQACTTGQPIPPKPSQPGVVILNNTAATASCVPLCLYVTTPSSPSAPDWAYENNSSCVLPNSVTGKNQTCTTGQPVPPPAPRPGILVVLSGADSTCVPVCAVAKTPTDPTAPDWSYENNAACVLPSSPTAAGKRACTAFGPPPSFVPPALSGTKVHEGFYTSNGRLFDAYGHAFVMRGVSNPHLYFDTGGRYLAFTALDAIAGYGTNTVRVVWDTTTLAGVPAVPAPAPASLLAEDLFRITQLKMVPLLELQGATGLGDTASLLAMANYYIRPEVKQVLVNFQDYLLINIANEWSGTANYQSAYVQAINLLRTNGISHTLVIDAPAFGEIVTSEATRNADIAAWFANAAALLQADPLHNLLFSVHMYDFYPAATPADVDQVLNFAGVGTTLALVVGEFGWMHDGISIAWNEIMAQCQARGIGYLGWSWFGNAVGTSVQDLNMVSSWGGPLTSPWGVGIMQGTNGIQGTSQKASIFP